MEGRPLLISGAHILDPGQGIDGVGDVLLTNGAVSWVSLGQSQRPPLPGGCQVLDARGMVLCPGFVDLHCHLREPGFEHKETIATGTRAAAAGGFTTVCCMPNTHPAIDSRATVEYVLKTAQREGVVRVLPVGCVTRDRKGQELAELAEMADAGAVGFSDDGDPVADSHLMRQALAYSLNLDRPIIDHCQDPSLSAGGCVNEGPVSYRLGLKGMPAAAEEAMVARDLSLAELTGGRLHLAHISTTGTVELIRRAKEKGIQVTAEVTPHHLTLTEEWVLGRHPLSVGRAARGPATELAYDTNAKVNPPLRTKADVQALVEGLRDGAIDAIATDHAPHARNDKECEMDSADFGISGFETALGLLMTLVRSKQLTLHRMVEALTVAPAKVIGCGYYGLKAGAPAELVLFDPERQWTVDSSAFISMGKNTPLDGVTLKGKVMATVFRSGMAYQDPSLMIQSSTVKERRHA